MTEKKRNKQKFRIVFLICFIFLFIFGLGLFGSCKFIVDQLMQTNQNMAVDVALLVKNNFFITDEEVTYLKGLTFNEMESDAINVRLMNIGNGVKLNATISNVYLLAPLADDEIKYITDEFNSEFFHVSIGTKLDGIWLLNGKIDEEGHFAIAYREDVYRYTKLTNKQKNAMREEKILKECSADGWGEFITGYVPIYTIEGNFVGLLGIDMTLDKYQSRAKSMVTTLIIGFSFIILALTALFLYFHNKYMRMRESKLYFDFYSRMSHDMRTPMNGILGMTELSKTETDVEKLHQYFESVNWAGKYMLGLINDTLDIQLLDAGKMKLSPQIIRGRDILNNIMMMVKPSADKKQILFNITNHNVDVDMYIKVDVMRLQQIFTNLLTNAIKFTPDNGIVTLKLQSLGENKNLCHFAFTITDTGIGMSEEFVKKQLFVPFSQEQNSTTTKYGGSGLGLSIVKNLVDLMQGRISVESKQGKGTSITVYLDIEKVDKKRAKKLLEEEKEKQQVDFTILNGKHVLICEDQPLNAEIASRLLVKKGCRVTIAVNGEEGVRFFSESKDGEYDLIIMDIRMPVMDGLTATKNIRNLKKENAADIPIIAMTANTYAEDIRNCIEAGMNAHIAKPISPEYMYKTIVGELLKIKNN